MKLHSSLLITLFTFFGFTTYVNVAIIYDANGTSVFTLIDSGGMAISTSSAVEPATSATTGTGVASIDADAQTPARLFPGTPLTQTSEVSGSVAPPFGTTFWHHLLAPAWRRY
jgi:hypothetical protein